MKEKEKKRKKNAILLIGIKWYIIFFASISHFRPSRELISSPSF